MRIDQLNRREFTTVLGGAIAAVPLAARAQSGPMRRLGVLMNGAATETVPQSYVAAFVEALRGLGWIEGQDLLDQYRHAATYVDRIFKGTKPGELPVQGAGKYTLAINLRTAKTLGLTVPLPLLGLADQVIE